MPESRVRFRPGLLAVLLGTAWAPAAWAGPEAAAACAEPALRDALRAKYPFVSVTLRQQEGERGGYTGQASCTVRAVDGALRRRMGVAVELKDAAGRARLHRVTYVLDARMAVWRLTDAAGTEAALRADQLVKADVDAVAEHGAIPADEPRPPGGWRLRQAMPAGHVLKRADVAPADSVLRGDAVNLVYRSGALRLQVQGQALSAAAPGEPVRVAVAGQREPVLGLLGEARLVEVQP